MPASEASDDFGDDVSSGPSTNLTLACFDH
jgi:hypothetical protein